jgi:hypothetical protein
MSLFAHSDKNACASNICPVDDVDEYARLSGRLLGFSEPNLNEGFAEHCEVRRGPGDVSCSNAEE